MQNKPKKGRPFGIVKVDNSKRQQVYVRIDKKIKNIIKKMAPNNAFARLLEGVILKSMRYQADGNKVHYWLEVDGVVLGECVEYGQPVEIKSVYEKRKIYK